MKISEVILPLFPASLLFFVSILNVFDRKLTKLVLLDGLVNTSACYNKLLFICSFRLSRDCFVFMMSW